MRYLRGTSCSNHDTRFNSFFPIKRIRFDNLAVSRNRNLPDAITGRVDKGFLLICLSRRGGESEEPRVNGLVLSVQNESFHPHALLRTTSVRKSERKRTPFVGGQRFVCLRHCDFVLGWHGNSAAGETHRHENRDPSKLFHAIASRQKDPSLYPRASILVNRHFTTPASHIARSKSSSDKLLRICFVRLIIDADYFADPNDIAKIMAEVQGMRVLPTSNPKIN